MERLSDNHEDRFNQYENGHNLCNEKEHSLLSFRESQWKLRQQHDQSFSMKQNLQDYESHNQGSKWKVNHLNKVVWDRKVQTKVALKTVYKGDFNCQRNEKQGTEQSKASWKYK